MPPARIPSYTVLRTTPRQQARKLTKTYRLLSRNAARLGIASALWFTYTDSHRLRRTTRRDHITDRMGLFTLKGRPKPSWFAFPEPPAALRNHLVLSSTTCLSASSWSLTFCLTT